MKVVPGVCEAGVAVADVATRCWMSKQYQGYRGKKVAGGASNRAKENRHDREEKRQCAASGVVGTKSPVGETASWAKVKVEKRQRSRSGSWEVAATTALRRS